MRKLVLIVGLLALAALAAKTALACTGYLTGESVMVIRGKGGYERKIRVCYYDHLGEPLSLSVPATSFCRASINVAHPGEDRDGDGKDDGEEQE